MATKIGLDDAKAALSELEADNLMVQAEARRREQFHHQRLRRPGARRRDPPAPYYQKRDLRDETIQ